MLYKLKKKYPSLPSNWEEGMVVGKGDRKTHFSPTNGKYTDKLIDDSEVINNPDYWEITTEKDFEILSFLVNGKIFNKKENDSRYWSSDGTYAYFNSYLNDKILSVKRLSDNAVFSIGNKAKTIGGLSPHIIDSLEIRQKVKSMTIDNSYIYDGIDRIWLSWSNDEGGNWLESTELLLEPIGTSVDGR